MKKITKKQACRGLKSFVAEHSPLEILHQSIIRNELVLKGCVTAFFDYEDKAGKRGTSKAGLYIQFNKKIKLEFGGERDSFGEEKLSLLDSLLKRLARIIEQGTLDGLLRKEIKMLAYAEIVKYGAFARDCR